MPKTTKHLKKYQFKPGQSGNPLGAKVMSAKQKVLKKLSQEAFEKCIEAVVSGNRAALEEMKNDPEVSVLQISIANTLLQACDKGDWNTVKDIVQTVTGKPPEKLFIHTESFEASHVSKKQKDFDDMMEKAYKKFDENV